MNTFDAIAQIRKQEMNRTDALRFLVERLGINVTYAGEIVAVVFGGGYGRGETKNTERGCLGKTA